LQMGRPFFELVAVSWAVTIGQGCPFPPSLRPYFFHPLRFCFSGMPALFLDDFAGPQWCSASFLRPPFSLCPPRPLVWVHCLSIRWGVVVLIRPCERLFSFIRFFWVLFLQWFSTLSSCFTCMVSARPLTFGRRFRSTAGVLSLPPFATAFGRGDGIGSLFVHLDALLPFRVAVGRSRSNVHVWTFGGSPGTGNKMRRIALTFPLFHLMLAPTFFTS